MIKKIIGLIVLTIIYLLYIQYSPGMGNIWYRNNEYYSINGALKLILFPFYNIKMWYLEMWDLNYFVWIIIYFLFTYPEKKKFY
tara:strand:- start:547 stop:798 length:252 start_codon:yes stop_codon:yes gene_type:complete